MPLVSVIRGVGNKIYQHAFPIYRLCYRGFKAYTDHAERRLLTTILSAGDVVVDAGANIGIYSEFLARRVGPTGVVNSFEPSPENFDQFLFTTLNPSILVLYQLGSGVL